MIAICILVLLVVSSRPMLSNASKMNYGYSLHTVLNWTQQQGIDLHIWGVKNLGLGNLGRGRNETNVSYSGGKGQGDSDGMIKVAIGMGITSKKMRHSPTIKQTINAIPLFGQFLPSFCETASMGFNYTFYISYDLNDPVYNNDTYLGEWKQTFDNITKRKCTGRLGKVGLSLIRLTYSGRLVWAQNDAMMVAYSEGNQYYYRVNDDTSLITPNWTHIFISELKKLDPPLVGVVGPNHRGGNTAIMTYDFVHRTHIDIFGLYYPRNFSWWYADDWITKIYRPNRSKKIERVRIVHTMSLGQRYAQKGLAPGVFLTLKRQAHQEINSYLDKIGYKGRRQ